IKISFFYLKSRYFLGNAWNCYLYIKINRNIQVFKIGESYYLACRYELLPI
uniref:Ovule protein n=1 Tax=Strongyloides papillosus TaxID=174720 RepID=A0A0N5BQ78_STREA